jgi:hypothetical protein
MHISRFLQFDQEVLSRIFSNPTAITALSLATSPVLSINTSTNMNQDLDISDPLTISLLNAGIDPTGQGLSGGLGSISPLEILKAAHKELLEIIKDQFSRAVKSMDEVGIVRFFKLFPKVGEAQAGLEMYGRFLCGIVGRYVQDAMSGVDERCRLTISPSGA